MSRGTCWCGRKEFPRNPPTARFIRMTCKRCGTVRSEEKHPPHQDPKSCSHRRTDHTSRSVLLRKTSCVDCVTYIGSVAREIHNELAATRPTSPAPTAHEEALTDRPLTSTAVAKRQRIAATRLLLEHVSRLDDGDSSNEQ